MAGSRRRMSAASASKRGRSCGGRLPTSIAPKPTSRLAPVIDTDAPLNEEDLDPDPIVEFDKWFRLAGEVGEPMPNAMALATATPAGAPAVRIVLLHRADAGGFVFYTNYESDQGPA